MNDAEPDFTAAELYDLLRVHARDKCAVCGVELQAHFGITKRPDGHFFCGKIEDSRGARPAVPGPASFSLFELLVHLSITLHV